MNTYRAFIRQLIRNYVIGSGIAVLGVGSSIIYMTLQLTSEEARALTFVLVLSLLVMLISEALAFRRHLRPIRAYFHDPDPSLECGRKAYFQAHRLPVLAVRRIMGPHLLGGFVPASLLLFLLIRLEVLSLPYFYIALGAMGGLLVASMHALIEFFLTHRAIRPLLVVIRREYMEKHRTDLTLDGQVMVSIQRKFQWSAFLIGTIPLLLLSLASQIRLGELTSEASREFWQGAAIILLMGVLFSSLGAWLLSHEVVHPIRSLFRSLTGVREGDFDTLAPDVYSDEFSRLVSGFNHMVGGLKSRELMNNQLIESYFSTLAAALDARDPYTAGHSRRVAAYSEAIGRLAGLPEAELDRLRRAALLHDIGKIGVRDAVLLKEGRLTDDEFAVIQLHPVLGENILKQIEPAEALADLLPGVRSHHERFDGTGYPDGLAGDEIPLMGRIIAIADAFDAMTSDRPYRRGMPVEKALAILEEGQGAQWDPRLVPLFVVYIRDGRKLGEDAGNREGSGEAVRVVAG